MKRLNSFQDFHQEAKNLNPLRTALISPENHEAISGMKEAIEKNVIEPVFIGNKNNILAAADKAAFNIENFEIIETNDMHDMASKAINLYYNGNVSLVCKGQIPTSHIYRAVIRKEKQINEEARISVFSIWDMTNPEKLILLTDTGVNIEPDWKTKAKVLKNAVEFMQLLGYKDIKALGLTASREIEENVQSLEDIEKIKDLLERENIPCNLEHGKTLAPFFEKRDDEAFPEIILVPHLEAGNIIVKLDFLLEMERFSVVMSSKGPVIVPSRSDTAKNVYRQLIFGAVISNRLQYYKVNMEV